MNYTLPLEMLYRWEKERADEIYLSQPIDGKIHEWSWKETSKQVRKMASYLKDNLPENSKIGILSKKLCTLDYERFSNYDGWSYICAFISKS